MPARSRCSSPSRDLHSLCTRAGVSRYGFELPLMAGLFIGGTLTATSIGITVRVLTDLQASLFGRGADYHRCGGAGRHPGRARAGIPVPVRGHREITPTSVGQVSLYIFLFVVLAP